ncbi:MAG: hypothetical protein HDR88_06215 [Bacteroides sp.]|nr:hypothetical protein [Bacteroides sp.]
MKFQRHIVVPILLAAYALFMTLYFGLDLLKTGHTFRFWATLIAETVVIILTFFALRRRDRLRQQRRNSQK